MSNFIYLFFFFVKQKDAIFSLFRSSTDGNYLYSSISLSLFGDDSTKKGLTIFLSCVLLLHYNNYCEHPVFLTFAQKYNIPLSRAFKFLCELVRTEAIKNCVYKSWGSFLCILALSSVCNRSI